MRHIRNQYHQDVIREQYAFIRKLGFTVAASALLNLALAITVAFLTGWVK